MAILKGGKIYLGSDCISIEYRSNQTFLLLLNYLSILGMDSANLLT